mmetsp:Transcript_98355/g.249642  ORF Transcript_98355/g.249642 Transcript_98355/m.249642 type:complete len:212 (-) Transcript_98355:86-721(-)
MAPPSALSAPAAAPAATSAAAAVAAAPATETKARPGVPEGAARMRAPVAESVTNAKKTPPMLTRAQHGKGVAPARKQLQDSCPVWGLSQSAPEGASSNSTVPSANLTPHVLTTPPLSAVGQTQSSHRRSTSARSSPQRRSPQKARHCARQGTDRSADSRWRAVLGRIKQNCWPESNCQVFKATALSVFHNESEDWKRRAALKAGAESASPR